MLPRSISINDDASKTSERPSILFSGIISFIKFGKLYRPSNDDSLQFFKISTSSSSSYGISYNSMSELDRLSTFSCGNKVDKKFNDYSAVLTTISSSVI